MHKGFRQPPQPEKKDIFTKLKLIENGMKELIQNDQSINDFVVKTSQVTIGRFQEISSSISSVAFSLRVLTEYLFEKGILNDKADFDSFTNKKRVEFFDEIENQQDQVNNIKVKFDVVAEGDVATIQVLKAVDASNNSSINGLLTDYLQVYTGNESDDFANSFNKLIDPLTKALIGRKAGDIVDAKVVLPSDFQDQLLAGKTVDFTIKILKVKSKI